MVRILGVVWVALWVTTAPAAAVGLIDFSGLSHETGGFPDSELGDDLALYAVVDGLTAPLTADFLANEYTLVLDGLVADGQQVPDPSNLVATYSGGAVRVYEDSQTTGTAAAPGTHPPNATAPAHYVDGTLYLEGTLADFTVFYNPQLNAGAFQAGVVFTGGSHLSELGAQTVGYTFGGVFVAGPPAGYDLHWDGQILLAPVPVGETTWGTIKSLYR